MRVRAGLCLLVTLLAPRWANAQTGDQLQRIWEGVQQAQNTYTSACGSVVETRTSKLLARPMALRGKFCAQDMTRFALEYAEPNAFRIHFDTDYLNVTTADGKTEVLEIGNNVRRAQSAFSREGSLAGLKRDFTIETSETSRAYVLKFTPRSAAFQRRLNFLTVKLDKRDFLPQSLEVDGKSGVNSVFAIDFASLNDKLQAESFEVQKPQ